MKRLWPIIILILSCMATPVLAQPGMGVDSNQIEYRTPRTYEIGGIRVTGNGGIREQVIIARSGLQVGDVIDIPGDEISNAIKKIYNTSLFSQVEIKLEKTFGDVAFLQIELQERPRLSRYFIRGIKDSEVDDLREKIRLSRGDPVTDYQKNRITNIITDFYDEKGFINSTIAFTLKDDTAAANSVMLFVDVNKGSKVKIGAITFTGNTQVSDAKLRSLMKDTKQRSQLQLTPKDVFAKTDSNNHESFLDVAANISYARVRDFLQNKVTLRIFKGSKFEEDLFETDKDLIVNYYNSKGYRDAAVTTDTLYQQDEENLMIRLKVHEGKRYYFRNITWNGNQKYPNELLSAILGINKGDIYNQELLDQRLFFDMNGQDISSLYMDDGYLFFRITPNEVRIVEDSIDVEIRVVEGPQATIDEVIIKGNDKTSERVVRRELRTLPGNKFSRSDLIRSQREIAALGFFDPEQLGIEPIPHPENGTVDIEYTVVEKPSDQIELSAGWGGQVAGVFGSAGIVFNNFSLRKLLSWEELKKGLPAGDGQQLSFRLQTRGRFLQSYTFSFTEPWFGGKKPNSLSVSFNITAFNPSGLRQSDPAARYLNTRGVTLAYGKRLRWPDDYFFLTSSLNFENYKLQNYTDFILSDGNSNNFFIRETLSRVSTVGNPNFPHGGSNISLTAQLTPPYSLFRDESFYQDEVERYRWIEYHKWRFNAEWYQLLAGSEEQGKRKLVLRAVAKLGYLGAYNGDVTGISPFERFRMGGDGLAGGFILEGTDIISLQGTENFFFPVGADASSGIRAQNAPIFNKFTLDLRYPVSLQQASTIYVRTFLEAGNAYASWNDYDPFLLRRSAGIGLRLFLPMFGLLGFDYGIPLDNVQGQSFGDAINNGAFQFRLGFEPD